MDEAIGKSGQWPNVAVEAGRDPVQAMREYGAEPRGLRTAAYDLEREIGELREELGRKQRVVDVQRDSFAKMEREAAALRSLALGLWRRADALRMAGKAPSQADLDEMAGMFAACGIEVS